MADAPIPYDIMQEAGRLLVRAIRLAPAQEAVLVVARALQSATERERQRCAEVAYTTSQNWLQESGRAAALHIAAAIEGGSNGK